MTTTATELPRRGRLAAGPMLGLLALSLTAAPVPAQDATLFQRLSGGWSGSGTVRLASGGAERIRCRGSYAGGGAQLRTELSCASDSFKTHVVSDIARQGDRVSGSWNETDLGVGGSLSGSVRGDSISTSFSGQGVSGTVMMTLRGNTQTVTIVSESSQVSGSSTVVLHRS